MLIRSLHTGGAERQFVNLALGLRSRGHDVTAAVFYGGGVFEGELRAAGMSVIDLGKRSRWDALRFLSRSAETLRSIRPDVIYTFMPAENLVGAMLRDSAPRSGLVWSILSSFMDLKQYDRFTQTLYALQPLAARRADLVIANSHAGRRLAVENGFPSAKVTVVTSGIRTGIFVRDHDLRDRYRSELHVSPDDHLVGIVGRFDPIKDHPGFLRAVACFRDRGGRARFAIVGSGDPQYEATLRRLAAELRIEDWLIWTGEVGRMTAVYSALDLLTSSSKGEGFSNVIAEAMSSGVPCVATDVGDAHEIIGETGLTVPPRNPEALAAAWHRILDGDHRQLGVRARERVVEMFSFEAMISSTESHLRSCSADPASDALRRSRQTV